MENEGDNPIEGNSISLVVQRYEEMVTNNGSYFFDVDEFEDLIEFYLDNNLPDKAFKVAEFALGQHPKSATLLLNSAQILLSVYKPQKALHYLKLAENIEPYNLDLHLSKANAFSQLRKPEKAIENYKKALVYADEKEKEDIFLQMAFENENRDRYDLAIEHLQEVLEINPENETAIYEIGFCFDASENTQKGLLFFKQFVDKSPYSYIGWHNMGMSYFKLDLYERAIECFDFSIAIKPDFSSAYFNKAHCLSNLENYKDAIECFEETLEYDAEDSYTFYCIGECYEKLEKYQKAIGFYKKSLDLDDFNADAWLGIGACHNELDQLQDAISYVKKAIKIDAHNPEYWLVFGDVQSKMGFLEEAKISFENVLKLEPENADIYSDLAWTHEQLDDYAEALRYFREGIEKFSCHAKLFYNFAAFLLKNGQLEESLFNLDTALSLNYGELDVFFEACEDGIFHPQVLELIEYHKK